MYEVNDHAHDVYECDGCADVARGQARRIIDVLQSAIDEWEGHAAGSAARYEASTDALKELDKIAAAKDAAMLRGLRLAVELAKSARRPY